MTHSSFYGILPSGCLMTTYDLLVIVLILVGVLIVVGWAMDRME